MTDLLSQLQSATGSHLRRFADKVEFDDLTQCWLWTAGKRHGYGRFRIGGRDVYSHRWLYEQLVGKVPDGLVLDHLCKTLNCVNPHHVEPVTQRENVLRGDGALKTHCRRGHELAGDNLRIEPSTGYRRCRQCRRIGLGRESKAEAA